MPFDRGAALAANPQAPIPARPSSPAGPAPHSGPPFQGNAGPQSTQSPPGATYGQPPQSGAPYGQPPPSGTPTQAMPTQAMPSSATPGSTASSSTASSSAGPSGQPTQPMSFGPPTPPMPTRQRTQPMPAAPPHVHPAPAGPPASPAQTTSGAATPPPAAAASRSRSGLLVATLVVAVLALVVGLAGVVIAAIALGRSDKATTLATSANERPLPPANVETPAVPEPTSPTDSPTETPEPGVTTSPGDISPTAEFAIAYQDQHLRVQTERCQSDYGAAVDFDEPRVIGGTEGDMVYDQCNPGIIKTGLPLAEVSGQSATPADCLENIRTTPAQSPIAPA